MDKQNGLCLEAAEKLAILAREAAKIADKSSEKAFENIVESIALAEQRSQECINTIIQLQSTFPMPQEGWDAFVRDIEYTNEKRGWNLQVDGKT